MNGIPSHWARVPLAAIAEVRLGRQRSPKRAVGKHMRPYMRAANVTWNGISLHDVKEMDFTPAEYEIYGLQRGDILLGEASGSPTEVGKPAIWREEVPNCCFQNTLIRVRIDGDLVPFLHLHFLKDARTGAFAQASRGVGIHHLGAEKLCDWEVTLPPLKEQHRIVEAIESYFTRLDAAVATLERVQANLRRYRASVLKAAVEGRLVPTEAEVARAEGREYEPATALLDRILRERRRLWEQTGLARMKAAGKVPGDDRWKAKYKEPVFPDTSSLPDLPEGWCWATWSQIGFSQNGRSFPSDDYSDEGVRLVRPGNLHISGLVQWTPDNTRRLPERYTQDFPGFVVGSNELLMNLTAQSLKDEFLGRICVTGPNERCLLNQRIARLTPVLSPARFLLWVFKSPWFRRFVDSLNTGSLIQHMFTSQLATFALPLPPVAEQGRIAAELERLMVIADSIEASAVLSVRRCKRLRESILRWAFEGKLVGQDPTDEPASVLLDRIKASPAVAAPAGARNGRRRARRGA